MKTKSQSSLASLFENRESETMKIITVEGNELHHKYPRESSPQKCHVELDCREGGTLSAEANPEIGSGVPFAVHNGHVQRWTIPALREDAANALLAEIAPIAERVVAGYSSEWDGHRHVGSFTEAANDAAEEIRDMCDRAGDEGDTVQVWEAADWFGGLGGEATQARELGITAETTDEELDAIAKREIAAADEVDELDGVEEHLKMLRETVREEAA